ncbi:MAG: glycosyl transferase family 1 [Proteobacteria bacterium SG_bin6]|nr:MAG: glycosyl transferase family 1 [Proteobacteria bacterium SG_bin6]
MGEILFLAHRHPFPPNRGDKIRGYHILRHLARRHRVHLIAFADDRRDLEQADGLDDVVASAQIFWRGKPRWRAAAEALALGRPVSLTAFHQRDVAQAVRTLLADRPIELIYVFSGQMAQYLPPAPAPRVIMDFVDMDSAKFDAYGAGQGPQAAMMRREGRLLFAFERDIAARAEASLFVSDAEAALFRARAGVGGVHAVENGIDTDFFDPAAIFPTVDGQGPLVVFTGQMDYRPNIEAVSWFARDVMPLLRHRHPDLRFAIVGRAPTEAVRALGQSPGVVVTGEVADVRGWLAAAQVAVAPLKLARGVQNKVLEAMAMARPVVASPAAAEGIDHNGALRVADSPAETSAAIGALLDNPGEAAALGSAARARVIARYGWNARLAPLDALIDPPRPQQQHAA